MSSQHDAQLAKIHDQYKTIYTKGAVVARVMYERGFTTKLDDHKTSTTFPANFEVAVAEADIKKIDLSENAFDNKFPSSTYAIRFGKYVPCKDNPEAVEWQDLSRNYFLKGKVWDRKHAMRKFPENKRQIQNLSPRKQVIAISKDIFAEFGKDDVRVKMPANIKKQMK